MLLVKRTECHKVCCDTCHRRVGWGLAPPSLSSFSVCKRNAQTKQKCARDIRHITLSVQRPYTQRTRVRRVHARARAKPRRNKTNLQKPQKPRRKGMAVRGELRGAGLSESCGKISRRRGLRRRSPELRGSQLNSPRSDTFHVPVTPMPRLQHASKHFIANGEKDAPVNCFRIMFTISID